MKANHSIARPLTAILVSVAIIGLTASVCGAQEWSRKGKAEIFAVGKYMGGDTTTGAGVTAELDGFAAGGIGFGYNFTDHLNLNLDSYFGPTDFTARNRAFDTDVAGADLILDINLLKGRFTPFLTGGIGMMNFNGDKFSETDFSYNIGVGARWDITDRFMVKAMYRATWTTLEDADDPVLLDGVSVNIGYMF